MSKNQPFLELVNLTPAEINSQLNSLRQNSPLLSMFIDLLDVCVQAVDKSGNIIFYSRGTALLEGLREQDVIGRPITDVYTIDGKHKLDEKHSVILQVLKTGLAITDQHMVFYAAGKKKVDVITDVYPVFSGQEIIAAVAIFRDITQSKQMSEKIIELQKSLFQGKTQSNGTQYVFEDIIGPSAVMQATIQVARKVAGNLSPVLIQGETGTGKELFAQSIHNASPRSDGPFVAVNCAAIPETLLESMLFGTSKGAFTGAIEKPGLFEEAQDGTLFLDEINSMSIHLQTKMLRVLQTKALMRVGSSKSIPVNARIISAINMDPKLAVEHNLLRSDIYYRLSVVSLVIPPLRERPDCVLALTDYFIRQNNKIMGKGIQGLEKDVQLLFKKYPWPGNVRELEHAIEHAMNLVENHETGILMEHLPPYLKNVSENRRPQHREFEKIVNLKNTLLKYEKDIIAVKLKANQGNISQTAKELNVSRQFLQYRIKRLKIKHEE